jgi:hypothetical protein
MAWFLAELSTQSAATPFKRNTDGCAVLPIVGQVSKVNIDGWRAGTIKLPFRKLNSILCEHSARSAGIDYSMPVKAAIKYYLIEDRLRRNTSSASSLATASAFVRL